MRNFNYTKINSQKWDSEILGLVASGELKREGAGKNICYYRLK